MSVHDETWDRPICRHCKDPILYGEASKHAKKRCTLPSIPFTACIGSILKNPKEQIKYIQMYAQAYGVEVLVNKIIHHPNFQRCSGSCKWEHHHYEDGGLLQHTYEVIKISQEMARMFEHVKIDREVLFLAALFHDYGKIWDYYRSANKNQWHANPHKRTIHHISRSAIEWNKLATEAKVNVEIIDKVTHCILSHHGQREYGSPVAPKSREAWILHLSDNMSARIDDCERLDIVQR